MSKSVSPSPFKKMSRSITFAFDEGDGSDLDPKHIPASVLVRGGSKLEYENLDAYL